VNGVQVAPQIVDEIAAEPQKRRQDVKGIAFIEEGRQRRAEMGRCNRGNRSDPDLG